MNGQILLFFLACTLVSCTNIFNEPKQMPSPLEGTWELISSTTIQDGISNTEDATSTRMIKIINDTHFAFLNHDLSGGGDSTSVFVAGGGIYTLKDGVYIEYLEYCNYREWEGNTFEFNIEISSDTLVQSGVEKVDDLGIDRIIIEEYVRTAK